MKNLNIIRYFFIIISFFVPLNQLDTYFRFTGRNYFIKSNFIIS